MHKSANMSKIIYYNFYSYRLIYPYLVHPCDTPSNGGCSQICEKGKDKYGCACEDGFVLGNDTKTCIKGMMRFIFLRFILVIIKIKIYWKKQYLVPINRANLPAINRSTVMQGTFISIKRNLSVKYFLSRHLI